MPYQETSGFCEMCNRHRLIRRDTSNNILHFLITFFTCGLWVFVWLYCLLFPGPWRCTVCGSRHAKPVS